MSRLPFAHPRPLQAQALLRRLRLRHIELLDTLGAVSSMRLASERMSLSQPAVSKMLREVETAFGVPLFDRSTTGLRPTRYGEIAVRQARIIRNELEVTADAVTAAQAGRGPVLRLGTLSVTSVVPKAILALRREQPEAVVSIREGAADVLIERLLANEIDCVVGALPPDAVDEQLMARIVVRPISLDHLCIVASNRHALASRRRLAWKDVIGGSWVLPPAGTMVRQAFVTACVQHGLEPPAPAVETLSPLTLSALLRSDPDLIGVMRSEQLRGEHQAFTLTELPVQPVAELPPIALLTRRSRSNAATLIAPFLAALQLGVAAAARP